MSRDLPRPIPNGHSSNLFSLSLDLDSAQTATASAAVIVRMARGEPILSAMAAVCRAWEPRADVRDLIKPRPYLDFD
jgi:hypothetical protein